MSETGWPLIPREVLPPAVEPPSAEPARRSAPREPGGHQLPMFGADSSEPSPADLAGLLAGPGRLDRMGGTARVTVRVDAAWRVHAVVAELVMRGLTATWAPVSGVRDDGPPVGAEVIGESINQEGEGEPGGTGAGTVPEEPPRPLFDVRTAYSRRLNGLARAWPAAAAQLFLSGPRLRLWAAAAGGPRAGGWSLGLDPEQDPRPVDAALVRAGLAGRVSDDGRWYLINGRRRVRRLAELVGDRPSTAPEEFWPGSAPA
ncbi:MULTISPECIES: hypothetical protein [Actinoplanes]|uniref:hypothetical protein n=1 Tax=Actinoplanes TaxID=1865 RepID=UPI0005F2A637|nr:MULTISPECIES: hypothetical protein [Actinoplanes]GLY05875.1 hypothetical protein Acsp01_62540 [Actinoplanes sp. NBRC 101535]